MKSVCNMTDCYARRAARNSEINNSLRFRVKEIETEFKLCKGEIVLTITCGSALQAQELGGGWVMKMLSFN